MEQDEVPGDRTEEKQLLDQLRAHYEGNLYFDGPMKFTILALATFNSSAILAQQTRVRKQLDALVKSGKSQDNHTGSGVSPLLLVVMASEHIMSTNSFQKPFLAPEMALLPTERKDILVHKQNSNKIMLISC